jgi:hypothetical protein
MECVRTETSAFENCLESRCCDGAGLTCYRKDNLLALCRQVCPSTWDCESLVAFPEPSPPPPPQPQPPEPSPPPAAPSMTLCIEDVHVVGVKLSSGSGVFGSLLVFEQLNSHSAQLQMTQRTALQPLTSGAVPLEARWLDTLCLQEGHDSQTCFQVLSQV